MLRRLRTVLLPLLALLGAVAWLLGQSATLVHDLRLQHERCLEHGELVELARSTEAHDHVPSDILQDVPHVEHDHGCDVLTTVRTGTPPTTFVLTIPPAMALPRPSAQAGDVHLAPTLSFAPKTSPPARA